MRNTIDDSHIFWVRTIKIHMQNIKLDLRQFLVQAMKKSTQSFCHSHQEREREDHVKKGTHTQCNECKNGSFREYKKNRVKYEVVRSRREDEREDRRKRKKNYRSK